MKRLLTIFLLSSICRAHPLSWLAGTYHGQIEGSLLEETWTEVGQELLGTTVWLEDGRVDLRELFRIRPEKGGYRLDLWLTFANGKGKHLSLQGKPEGTQKVVFRGQRGDRLTYLKQADGGLRCELQKEQLTVFEMKPGPRPAPTLPPAGDYVLHTYLGEQLFADELHWDGQGGSLSVPGQFKANLEQVAPSGDRGLSFEIQVPEGPTPYRVRYQMHFTPDQNQATGSLINLSNGQTMACFVARRKNQLPQ